MSLLIIGAFGGGLVTSGWPLLCCLAVVFAVALATEAELCLATFIVAPGEIISPFRTWHLAVSSILLAAGEVVLSAFSGSPLFVCVVVVIVIVVAFVSVIVVVFVVDVAVVIFVVVMFVFSFLAASLMVVLPHLVLEGNYHLN